MKNSNTEKNKDLEIVISKPSLTFSLHPSEQQTNKILLILKEVVEEIYGKGNKNVSNLSAKIALTII